MKVYNNHPIISENIKNQTKEYNVNPASSNFKEILDNKIIFSKHANTRLSSRELNLSPEQMQRLESGVIKAKLKGINESLVLVDDVALVVNIKNKMVITAIGKDNENIFTNIDGAVIV